MGAKSHFGQKQSLLGAAKGVAAGSINLFGSASLRVARRQRVAAMFRSDWIRNQTTGLKTIHSMKMAIPGYLLLVKSAYSKE